MRVAWGEAVSFGCFCELVDEVAEVGGIEIHEFVDVGEVRRGFAGVWVRRWRVGAAEDVGEGLIEVGEEAAERWWLAANSLMKKGEEVLLICGI